MKQLFCQLLIFLLLIFADNSCSGGNKASTWGYLVRGDNLSEAYLQNIMTRFSAICLTGFMLGENERIITPADPILDTIIELSRKKGVTLYPVVSFESVRAGRSILSDEQARKRAARSIAGMADKHGFPGIHLDFEYIPPEYARRLGLFLDDLRKEFSGCITMAVFPRIGFPEKWSGFHDLSIISPRVDAVVLMCYDLHGSHTGPGPVTDVTWAEKNVAYALSYVKPDRLLLGMPAYGYRWCGSRSTALSSRKGVKQAARHNARRDPSGTLFYKSGNSCLTYVSDRHTRSLLKSIADRYGLAGTAVWRIGFEE
jgi:spore germination protein YaaH